MACIVTSIVAAPLLQAQTIIWTNTASGFWSAPANWSNNVAPAAGGSTNLTLVFAGSGRYTASNDLPGTFSLNELEVRNPSATNFTLAGNAIQFVTSTNGAAPRLAQNGAADWAISNAVTLANSLTLASSQNSDVTFAGAVGGAGGLTKTGGNTVYLNAANSFSGAVYIQQAVLQCNHVNALASAASVTVVSGAQLALKTPGTYDAPHATISGNGGNDGAIRFNQGTYSTYTWPAPITLSGYARLGTYGIGVTNYLNGPIGGSGSLSLFAQGGGANHVGVYYLGATNTYSGTTSIDAGSAADCIVRLNVTNALPSGTRLTLENSGTRFARLDLNGRNQTVAGLNSDAFVNSVVNTSTNAVTLTLNASADCAFSGSITGRLVLVKNGAGQFTLAGTNSFAGPLTVNAGRLVASGSNIAAVTIADGARLSAAATLSVGTLTLATNSEVQLTLSTPGSGTNAPIRVSGSLTLRGALLVDGNGPAVGSSYAAFSYTSNLTVEPLTTHTLSRYEVAVETNTPGLVRFRIVRVVPFAEFALSDGTSVSSLNTNLSVVLHGSTTKPLWYEVRDQAGRLWDYGAHAAASPWNFTVRHLRPGTNSVTVFALPSSGGTVSNTLRLVISTDTNSPVRPRPVPAEIWWGGSCHDNLYDTNGNIVGTYSRLAQLTNTAGWDFVKRWQDGFMLHGYVWVNGVARMTNRAVVGPAIAAQLAPFNGRYILENAWRPRTNSMSYGTTSAPGQSDTAATLEGLGMYLSDITQDYNPLYREFSEWHPEWPTNDLRVAGTGNTNDASPAYPYPSGQWRDLLTAFKPLRPYIKMGWTWSPVWFSWLNGPSLGSDHGVFNFTQNGTNYSFAWDFYDFMNDAVVVGNAVGSPFGFASDCPWDYFGEYPGNPGGWSQAHQFNNRKKIRDYEAWLWARGLKHTMICNSSDNGSASNPDAYDLQYRTNSLKTLFLHQQEGGRASRYLFESWYEGPFTMLPETKPGSYANLARDAIKFLKGIADTNGTPQPLTLSVLNTGSVVTLRLRNDGDYRCLPVLQAFEGGTGTVQYSNAAGANITTAVLSADGYAHTNFLEPGASTTFTVSISGAPAPQSKTVTLEAFWNPQDPTGLVRDRVTLALPPPQTPFAGTPATIPGTIQAEDYDFGGEGVAYHDLTLTNVFARYRPFEAVDVENCTDTGGGFNVADTKAGEWLEYSVNALYAGPHSLEVRVASSGNGGTFHVEMDGANITGPITVTNTGGWQSWRTYTRSNINLTAGPHTVRLSLDTNGATSYVCNFNWLRFTGPQPPVITLVSPTNRATASAPITLLASVTDPDNDVTNVSFFCDGTLVGAVANPAQSFGWTNPPGGYHLLHATATDTSGFRATSAPVFVAIQWSTQTLVAAGAEWKYSDQGLNLSNAWRAPGYDDSAWPAGPAPLGYGDANGIYPRTTNSFGPVTNNKHITTYYRSAFVVPDLPGWSNATVAIQRDDGAVVYLNGTEIFRSNMPTGAVSHLTLALGAVASTSETNWHFTNLNGALLLSGTNLLAVEIHQNTNTSSDLWFDLRLAAQPVLNAAPAIRIVPGAAGYELRWPAWAAGVPVWWAADLAPSAGWELVPPAGLVVTNGEAVLPVSLQTPQTFFRLQWP